MNLKPSVVMIGVMSGVSCSGSQHAVRPDQMSAAEHEQEAAKDQEAANSEIQEAKSPALQPNLSATAGSNPQGYYAYPVEMYDPRTEHLIRAEQLSKHAQEHQAAAASLETFEEAECKEFPPATRAACPLLGPLVGIVDVPGGVRAQFKEGIRVDAIVAHMRCHYAYARAHGFDAAVGCPLYVRGIEIRRSSDPRAVEIVGPTAATTSVIRSRAREESVVVHAGAN